MWIITKGVEQTVQGDQDNGYFQKGTNPPKRFLLQFPSLEAANSSFLETIQELQHLEYSYFFKKHQEK